jgi:hypothetical protein
MNALPRTGSTHSPPFTEGLAMNALPRTGSTTRRPPTAGLAMNALPRTGSTHSPPVHRGVVSRLTNSLAPFGTWPHLTPAGVR